MASSKTILCYVAVGFLILGLFIDEIEARRTILQGRKVLNRQYYRSSFLPAWLKVLLSGIGMMLAGGLLYYGMKKLLIDALEMPQSSTYHAVSDQV